jgi:hypothetical protein
MITWRGSFKGIRSGALRVFFVLFKALTISGNVRPFHKTKNPQQYAAGLI